MMTTLQRSKPVFIGSALLLVIISPVIVLEWANVVPSGLVSVLAVVVVILGFVGGTLFVRSVDKQRKFDKALEEEIRYLSQLRRMDALKASAIAAEAKDRDERLARIAEHQSSELADELRQLSGYVTDRVSASHR